MEKYKIKKEKKALRDGFGDAISELTDDPNVVVLTADLGDSVKASEFGDNSRYIECGISEQNMISVASGIALTGKKVFATSFACFIPYRVLDQVRMSVCSQNANVKLIGSHSGLSYSDDGVGIQALEDIAIMRSLPNMKVYVPSSATEAYIMTMKAANEYGPIYIRTGREKEVDFEIDFKNYEINKAKVIREGNDVVIYTCGAMLSECIEAAEILSVENSIECSILNVSSIKPIDTETIIEYANKCKKGIVVEEHQKFGGLFGAISEVLIVNEPIKLDVIAIQDKFGQSGRSVLELRKYYGLSKENIIEKVINICK
ncbi:MAG: transketolase C-terminal domain-containing protein [bacterium]